MPNPTVLFERIKDTYLRYLDSPFDLRYEPLVAERRELLDQDGRLYREPLIEPVPPYVSSGRTFAQAANELFGSSWTKQQIAELTEFVTSGLFPPERQLYQHQFDALNATAAQRQDAVITSGTGSGKTECFLLPLMAALVEESARWGACPAKPPAHDWWSHRAPPGTGRVHHPRVAQRGHENPALRPAAMRALIMYPLNALVEDQLARLRDGLDSRPVRDWLDAKRGGHRFYFGRYTGRTPIAGDRNPSKEARLRNELLELQADAQAVARNSEAARFFQSLTGAEMWSRWDMQDQPPDILITNYSMLNIMLMRGVEAPIFDATRDWLRSDSRNVFHLIVDELHTYRGTPGTEVAFLIRVLLDRLGLHPEHDQLRIIASSASLSKDDPKGAEYLEGFFGRDRARFQLIDGELPSIDGAAAGRAGSNGAAFAALGQALQAERSLDAAVADFEAAIAAPNLPANTPPDIRLGSALRQSGAVDAIRFACRGGDPVRIMPKQLRELAPAIFPGMEPQAARAAAEGLVAGVASAAEPSGDPLLPMRAHIMFRNVQGMWVCSDPSCSEVPGRSELCPVGKLHHIPTPSCGCGARVLELLYCEPCGEVFLGGYRGHTDNPNEWRLSPDFPDLEQVPDKAGSDRDYDTYAVFWPTTVGAPLDSRWTLRGDTHRWIPAHLDNRSGIVANSAAGNGYLYNVQRRRRRGLPPTRLPAFPCKCPRCDADWSGRDGVESPIRGQRTGFQKIAQLLGDGLLREIASPSESDKRKLVVFSDSRQDAAKLSAGMRQSHYLDAVRQALVEAIDTAGNGAQAFAKFARGDEPLSPEEQALAAAYNQSAPQEASILSVAAGRSAGMPCPQMPSLTYSEAAAAILTEAAAGPYLLADLFRDVQRQLLLKGINPGGYKKDALWTDFAKLQGGWRDLYDWLAAIPAPRSSGLAPSQLLHLQRLQQHAVKTVVDIVFASGRRGLESLQIAHAALPGTSPFSNDHVVCEAANGVLRLLGERRRIHGHPYTAVGTQSEPPYIREYLDAVAIANGRDRAQLGSQVRARIDAGGLCNAFLINPSQLRLQPAGERIYECGQCRRIHLNPSAGVCTDCLSRLNSPQAHGEGATADDYYSYLARHAGELFRLNCEELTGQTSKVEARKRQRLFQGVCLGSPQEEERTDTIDLLSVTTTMEAGVDIGSLQAVMMANMPPLRFNYQQRVGRAGRRRSPLSIALTLCRGRSHDDYYFQRPERITSDRPPLPYVDMASEAILLRVLAKEVLREAFASLGLFAGGTGESVHGEFGDASAWLQPLASPPAGAAQGATVRDLVERWISSNVQRIEEICDVLLHGADTAMQANRPAIVTSITGVLLNRIDDAVRSPHLTQQHLSERLANAGVLPMFGFPTRVRNLYHRNPDASGEWPPEDVVDRPLDVAISQFAPGSETVKEGLIHTAVGVVDYHRIGNRIDQEPNPLGPPIPVGMCYHCQSIDPGGGGASAPTCKVCNRGAPDYRPINLSQPAGFRTWYGSEKDYDGTFDWAPRATRPKLSVAPSNPVSHANFDVFRGTETVYVVNDNNGDLFQFEHFNRHSWMTRDALSKVGALPAPVPVAGAMPDPRALAAITPTDVLVMGMSRWPTGIFADPLRVEGRAAYYSFGFMLRRAAAVRLDVGETELKVGLRTTRDPSGAVSGQVFISDTLENGAGYSTYLGRPEELHALLDDLCGDSWLRILDARAEPGDHGHICHTSCHDCMRDYSNLAYHSILDWRLGIDLARLALDASAPIDFTPPYWSSVAELAASKLRDALPDGGALELAGLPAVQLGRRAFIICHPLWDVRPQSLHPALAAAQAAASAAGLTPEFRSTFMLMRRPL